MMSWIPHPATRQLLTLRVFIFNLLPAILLYYVTALLVLLPGTFPLRLALLPVTLYSIFCCATRIDIAKGFVDEPQLAYFNHALILAMVTISLRVSIWTFCRKPYTRSKSGGNIFLDAADLVFNYRGIGWSWSKGLKIAEDQRNVANTPYFIFSTTFSLLINYLLFDFSLLAVQSFGSLDSPTGASIFDPTLSPCLRYFCAFVISSLAGLAMCYAFTVIYLFGSLFSIVFLQQSPEQWPPLFDQPWLSTSINQFWSISWHQLFRHNFIMIGGYPGYHIAGRPGAVLGAFLVSGILHFCGLWGMGRGTDFNSTVGYFLMMGVGIILESVFKKVTGVRVQGFWGWLWSHLWILGWGMMLMEAWAIRGLAGSAFQPQATRPSIMIVNFIKHTTQSMGYY